MPMTIRDADDAFLEGTSKVTDWLRDFEAAWNEPHVNAQMAYTWQRMIPPQIKQLMAMRQPETFERVNKKFGGRVE